MTLPAHFEMIVIGSGPAGQNAAVQAVKAGKSVLLVERDRGVGGACVHRGTIPSKTLRETASFLGGLKKRGEGVFEVQLPEQVKVASLTTRLRQVIDAHQGFIARQLDRNEIVTAHGRARFLGSDVIAVRNVRGEEKFYSADHIVVATGSTPRVPPNVPIDHEHILDSDSILSINYLPQSLVVLGGGVIASEYASIFASLGVEVVMVDKAPRPLAFLDEDLSHRFVRHFETLAGSKYFGSREVKEVRWDGVSAVETELTDGEVLRSDKLLCALGRIANVADLGVEAAGLEVTSRGLLEVDEFCRTSIPHIYAVGDVIGPPALASSSMEQGRRAARHALNLPLGKGSEVIPAGIYTIPEISTIGLTEEQVIESQGSAVCGESNFSELARAQIAFCTDGYLKLVADAQGRKLMGAQIFGEGATELIHVAQMALLTESDIDLFIENIFNFPTLAEAYRVAALQIVRKRPAQASSPNPNPMERVL
ncbi:MAG: Si-specific NAD(P)(+) transhydrogenase [Planctomycetota bacterium]|jgi:NAD(P) transhydrogenase